MKIEKINDNQIRCTLTRADLDDRHLKLSELAYGSEKAKSLFQDMMQQASSEFGFEADDMPLMIEAIPSADSIVLIITKVEDPEELDTRFSKFAPSPSDTADAKKQTVLEKLEGAEQLLDILDKVKNAVAKVQNRPYGYSPLVILTVSSKHPIYLRRCTMEPALCTKITKVNYICLQSPSQISLTLISTGSATC